MSRLTRKDISDNYDLTYENGDFVRGIMPNEKVLGEIYINGMNKLGKIEDLEDELGCPLDVVFKALKDGIYCYDSDNEEIRKFITHFQYNSTSKEYYWYGNNIHFPNLKDYKKTWFLFEKGEK